MSVQDSIFTQFMEHLFAGARLQRGEMRNFMDGMLQSSLSDVRVAAILTAFRLTPLTQDVVMGALESLVKPIQNGTAVNSLKNRQVDYLVDNSGTGGDGSNTYNISTMAAVVAAAAGAKIAKFGTRSISSRCGSADVLEALGVHFSRSLPSLFNQLDRSGISYLYAPSVLPALQHLSAVRKSLGFHTIFDLLVPMANPAPLSGQLIGVYSADVQVLAARCLQDLGRKRALVVHSEDGLDEISVCGPSRIIQLVEGQQNAEIWSPADFGMPIYKKDALRGAGIEENAHCFTQTLQGKNPGAVEDAVVLNAAATLWCASIVNSIPEGIQHARATLKTGAATQKLEQWRTESLESPAH